MIACRYSVEVTSCILGGQKIHNPRTSADTHCSQVLGFIPYTHALHAGGQGHSQTKVGLQWGTHGGHINTRPQASKHHENHGTCLVGGLRQGRLEWGAAVLDDFGVL